MKLNTILLSLSLGVSALSAAEGVQSETETQDLDTVHVKGRAVRAVSESSDQKLRDQADLGLLGRQNTFSAPITVVNYDEKMIENSNQRMLTDMVAKTDASVISFGGEAFTLQGLYIRGQRVDARQFNLNGLSGIYTADNSPSAGIGSVQLIKGASTALTGMDPEGSAGANVNFETKKATDRPVNKIGLSWFADNRLQPSFDFGRRFGAEKQWGVRLNGLYRNGNTPRRGYKEEAQEFAFNTDYRSGRFKAALDILYNRRDAHGARARLMLPSDFQVPSAPDGRNNLTPPWHFQDTKTSTAMFNFEYDAGFAVLSGAVGKMKSRRDSIYSGNYTIRDTDGLYRADVPQTLQYDVDATAGTLKARGEFHTGPVSHNWHAAFDSVRRVRNTHRQNLTSYGFSSNIYHPVHNAAPASMPARYHDIFQQFRSTSFALSDTLGFSQDRLRLTLGARFQKMENTDRRVRRNIDTAYKADALNPMLTAVYQPSRDWAFYANYLEDLSPGVTIDDSSALNDGETLKPSENRQFEFGIRHNRGNTVVSANVYRTVEKAAYLDTATRLYGYNGEIRRSGLELSTYANLLNQTLRPSLSIGWTRAELRNYQVGSRTVSGLQHVNSPRFIAKAGVEWDAPFNRNLTLNAGIQYYGKSFQDVQNRYTLPSYTLIDAGVGYRKKLGGSVLTVSAQAENLTNKKYWQPHYNNATTARAVLGMPRTYWLKAAMDF